jgi:hypothetical protein
LFCFLTKGIDSKTDANKQSDSIGIISVTSSTSTSSTSSSSELTKISTHTADMNNKKDLVLRDQTRSFIQSISIFISLLKNENYKIDNELKAIMVSLKCLIEAIEGLDLDDKSEIVNEQANKLETCLSLMVNELKLNHIESVINSALELARSANELFLTLTKSNTIS